MAETPTYGWRTPDAEDPSDGPNDMLRLGTDIENTLKPVADRLEERTWHQIGFDRHLDVPGFTIPLPANHQFNRLRLKLRGSLEGLAAIWMRLNGDTHAGKYTYAFRRWDSTSSAPIAIVHEIDKSSWSIGAWGTMTSDITIEISYATGSVVKTCQATSTRNGVVPSTAWWQESWGHLREATDITSIRIGTTSNPFRTCNWWLDGAIAVGLEDDTDPGEPDEPGDGNIPDQIPGSVTNADGIVVKEPSE